MANEEQLSILRQGVEAWNKWREENPDEEIDLTKTDFSGSNLEGANFQEANIYESDLRGVNLKGADLRDADIENANLNNADLRKAKLSGASLTATLLIEANLNNVNLTGADLIETNLTGASLKDADLRDANIWSANLSGADLRRANLSGADLQEANLRNANLQQALLSRANLALADLVQANLKDADISEAIVGEAHLNGANFTGANLAQADLTKTTFGRADLSGADLSGADLRGAVFIETTINNAKISNSRIYGISAWDLVGTFKEQKNLIITPPDTSGITVDNIEVAQFIYLILNNKKIRDVINTLQSKTVLILGRFAIPERKAILDTLRDKLREYDLLPIVFDFDRPTDKDFTETIKTLAGMAYFVIADVTNPKSSPLELQATVPDYQIPFVPIIQEGESPFAMMVNLQTKYNWVLDTISYDSIDTLVEILKPHIIDPAIKKHDEMRLIKARVPTIISGKDLVKKKSKRKSSQK